MPVTFDLSPLKQGTTPPPPTTGGAPGASAAGGPPTGGVSFDLSQLKAPPTSGGAGGMLDQWGSNEGIAGGANRLVRGFLKTASSGLGGIADMIRAGRPDIYYSTIYKQDHPDASDDEIQQAYSEQYEKTHPFGARMAQHLADAADWLRAGTETHGVMENLGAIGEQALEYIGTDGLLEMAGPSRTLAMGERAMGTAERLKNAQQVAATLKANPKLAGLVAVGAKASREAMLMAGQTELHTGDPTQAAIAGGLGAGGSLVASGLGAIGTKLAGMGPTAKTIEGVEVPLLKEQLGKTGAIVPTGAELPADMAEKQQAGAGQMFQNMSQRVAGNILEDVNRATGLPTAEEGAMRLAQYPGEFTVKGLGPVEETTGTMAQSAAKVPGRPAAFEPQYTTASAPTREEIVPTKYGKKSPVTGVQKVTPGRGTVAEGQMGADIRTATTPEAKADVVTGGGDMTTKDPHQAIAWRSQLQDVINSPEFSKLSATRQAQIREQYTGLRDQLAMYHASPYGPRMANIDVPAATQHIQTPGQAAAAINAALEPGYQELNRLQGGRFDVLRRQVEEAQAALAKPNISVDAERAATQKMNQANVEIDNMIRDNAGATPITRQYFRAMQGARQDTVFLENLHARLEGMTNGITVENTTSGLPRVMTGNTRSLEQFLSEGSNRNDLVRLFGEQSESNLKEIMNMLSNANTARSTTSVLDNSVRELEKATRRGAMAGGILGAAIPGGSWKTGAAIGTGIGASIWGVRNLLRYAATSPRIGQMVTYAAQHNLSPQVYAPLIARAVAQTTGVMEPQQK